jgi:hypothetical protein
MILMKQAQFQVEPRSGPIRKSSKGLQNEMAILAQLKSAKIGLLRQISFMARGKTDMLSGLIRKSPLAPLFPPGQAPPRLPARRGLSPSWSALRAGSQLGEKGSCPGGRPYGPAAKEGDNNFPLWQRGNKGDFANCRSSNKLLRLNPPLQRGEYCLRTSS